MTPFEGRVKTTSLYGWRWLRGKQQFHPAEDLVGLDSDRVRVVAAGRVCEKAIGYNGGRGNYIRVLVDPVTRVLYQHLNEVYLNKGDYVLEGAEVGRMGWTGDCVPAGPGGAHLHIGVEKLESGVWIHADPVPYTGIPNRLGVHAGDDKEQEGAQRPETEEGEEEMVLRIYTIGQAYEGQQAADAAALGAIREAAGKGEDAKIMALSPAQAGRGDGKWRVAYPRMARQYTLETHAAVYEALCGEMKNRRDEILV